MSEQETTDAPIKELTNEEIIELISVTAPGREEVTSMLRDLLMHRELDDDFAKMIKLQSAWMASQVMAIKEIERKVESAQSVFGGHIDESVKEQAKKGHELFVTLKNARSVGGLKTFAADAMALIASTAMALGRDLTDIRQRLNRIEEYLQIGLHQRGQSLNPKDLN